MINVDELRRMSPQQRAELSRALAALDDPVPPGEADLPAGPVRRAIALVVIIGGCLGLAAWIGVLAVTLPRYYHTGGWRGAWVGFDIFELVTFAVTAWAAWKHRQLVIACLIVLATLLCCDAWFDVTLDLRTSGFWVSLLLALCVELPLAALALFIARRLLRLNIRALRSLSGLPGVVPPLWKLPLYGMGTHGIRTVIPEPCVPVEAGELVGAAGAGQRASRREESPAV
ncbi:MAG: hypothetical protein ACLPKI_24225 [Streptosporangiaceae bacterium]